MRRPALRIRYGKTGAITSPTSSAGHVGHLLLSSSLLLVMVATLHRRGVDAGTGGAFLVLAVIVGLRVRDAWAWFVAGAEERDAFLAEVAQRRAMRRARTLSHETSKSRIVGTMVPAALVFGLLFVVFAVHLPALVIIPTMGWLYVLARVLWDERRNQGLAGPAAHGAVQTKQRSAREKNHSNGAPW
jgi:hypothetical protein